MPARTLDLLVLNWLDRENPQAGGAEVHLHETFGRLAARGWNVTAVTSGWPGAERRVQLDGMAVHRVGSRYLYGFAAPRYVRKRLAEVPCDLLVEDLNKVPLFTPWWAPAPRLLLVHHLFGSSAFGGANPVVASATWLSERAIPRAYAKTPIVAVSASTRGDLVRRGLPAGRIDVVENGVDTDKYTPAPNERFPRPTLLYLGRLKRYKRIDLVFSAVAEMRRAGDEVTLLVAGDGDDAPRLERLASELVEAGAVRFLGRVSEDEKLRLMRGAWAHVLTSTKEGWGITNLEAAACGTPSVTSDSPGLRDSVIDGRTGYLVPHGDVDALVGRLRLLLSSTDLREAMGRAARDFATSLSWERTTDRMAEKLLAAVDSAGVRG